MFLNRFTQNVRKLRLQRPLKRIFDVNARSYSQNTRNHTTRRIVVGVTCSVTILSTLGLAYAQTKDPVEENEANHPGKRETLTVDLKREEGLKNAIEKSNLRLEQVKEEFGIPGLVCAVSFDGEVVWNAALGFSDVENGCKCNVDTKMRIASISKALTSIAIAKLIQEGKIDVDAPIQQYVKYFPEKQFENEPVTITTRQLMSHTSGVRHYDKKLPDNDNKETAKKENQNSSQIKEPDGEFENKEYYLKDNFKTTQEAAKLFMEDPLLKKPGTDFLYSTHAWTLLSGVIEGVSGMDYTSYMKDLCYDLGLDNTLVEENNPLIYNRSRNYSRNEKGRLQNSPYVDNSYKISGGGFLSTTEDLLKIGNVMLYCHQNEATGNVQEGYLKKETIDKLWTIEKVTEGKVSKSFKHLGFGLGWQIQPEAQNCGCCRHTKFAALHNGAAVGSSSVLLIVPTNSTKQQQQQLDNNEKESTTHRPDVTSQQPKPRGIVVAIMVNMQSIALLKTAFEIAENFGDIPEQ